MAHVLVVIPSAEAVRSLLRTGALASLQRAHHCTFIAPAHLDPSESPPELAALGTTLVGRYRTAPGSERFHAILFDALMWRHRHLSRTFLYRWMRTAGIHRIVRDRGWSVRLKSTMRWAFWVVRKWSPLRTVLLGSRLLHPIARLILIRLLPVNRDLQALLAQVSPELVVYPTNAYESTGIDLARICRGLPTRSLFIVDNWDNLSSKTVMWASPDHLAVWGEQSREHAVEIQGIAAANVSIIGTARFDAYYTSRDDLPASPYPFPYVLFVGAALANDELAVLRILDGLLADAGTMLRVVYRPHPWQHPRAVDASFDPRAFRNIVLDRQFLDGDRPRVLESERGSFQPDLSWYPALLTNARFVMGPLTTMLLEGSVCRRRVLALAHDDGIHFTTPSQAYRWYRHFEGIEGIEGFEVCHNLEDLPSRFLRLSIEQKELDADRVDRSVDRFVHHDGRPFSERLLETVDRVLAQPPSA